MAHRPLEKAIAERKPPPGVVHHSDRGVQYASGVYLAVLQKYGMNPEHEPACESVRQRQLREFDVDSEAGGDLREPIR
jgi:transposase InsO family protein